VGQHTFWTTLSWVEVGLGAASFIPGLDVITLPLFVAGAALSSLSTAHSCATGSKHACGFGVTSTLVGGGGFGAYRGASRFGEAANAAAGSRNIFKAVVVAGFLEAAQSLTKGVMHVLNGGSLISSGLTNLPCSAYRIPGSC
jgi:hypothetical protein